jgi:uncharacterized protein with PQ loop repeat
MLNCDVYAILGSVGMLLTTLSGAPQVYKTIATKSVNDLSLGFYSVLTIGLVFGLIYVTYLDIVVYIIGNTISLTICIILIYCILRWREKK